MYYRGPPITQTDSSGQTFIVNTQQSYKVVTLAQNNYTLQGLANEIQTKLRASLDSYMTSVGSNFAVTFDASTNSLTISMTGTNPDCYFKLLTDAEVKQNFAGMRLIGASWVGASVDPGNLKSANDVLKLVKPMSITTSWVSGFVNLNHINNIYITSPNLGSFDTISTFSNNIIKKVPVTGSYGYMIIDQYMTANDFLDCSGQTLKTIEFHLRDGRGKEIDLKGMYVTFSLVFNKYNVGNL